MVEYVGVKHPVGERFKVNVRIPVFGQFLAPTAILATETRPAWRRRW